MGMSTTFGPSHNSVKTICNDPCGGMHIARHRPTVQGPDIEVTFGEYEDPMNLTIRLMRGGRCERQHNIHLEADKVVRNPAVAIIHGHIHDRGDMPEHYDCDLGHLQEKSVNHDKRMERYVRKIAEKVFDERYPERSPNAPYVVDVVEDRDEPDPLEASMHSTLDNVEQYATAPWRPAESWSGIQNVKIIGEMIISTVVGVTAGTRVSKWLKAIFKTADDIMWDIRPHFKHPRAITVECRKPGCDNETWELFPFDERDKKRIDLMAKLITCAQNLPSFGHSATDYLIRDMKYIVRELEALNTKEYDDGSPNRQAAENLESASTR